MLLVPGDFLPCHRRTRRIIMPRKIDNQDLEHQRDKTLVNDKGVKVTPPPPGMLRGQKELERVDRAAAEAVRKLEESRTKLPPY
jgi:hypothetical protein